ncbi:MAG: hypothetical protein ABR946_01160 [Solirubrobacteraceae bacterium]
MRTRLLAGLGTAIVMTLISAASAMALPGTRTFVQTYPFASALCVKAEAGSLGKRLEPSRDPLLNACTTLKLPFAGLEATVTSAEAQYSQTVANESALVLAACPQPLTQAERPACRTARMNRRSADSSALLARHDAVVTFVNAIEANRVTFWSTVHSLRGGAGLAADQPIAQPTPQQNPS